MTKVMYSLTFVLAATFGSSASAVTPEQMLEIWSSVHIDASSLSDVQAASVINAMHSSDSNSEARSVAKSLIRVYR